MKKIYHPGIENEYVFDSWEEARETLEKHHGGLASGMLANCREIEVLEGLREKLEDLGFEDRGQEYNNTRINCGAERSCDPRIPGELKALARLSANRWAKWYYTDPVGNPVYACAAKYEE